MLYQAHKGEFLILEYITIDVSGRSSNRTFSIFAEHKEVCNCCRSEAFDEVFQSRQGH